MNRTRVLLADDNKALAERVAEFLSPSFEVVGVVHDGQDLIDQALRLDPEVIVVDITMPLFTGIEAVHQLRATGISARVVFLTIHDEEEFFQACLKEGATGYVVKSRMKSDLIPAINSAMLGRLFFSSDVATSGGQQG